MGNKKARKNVRMIEVPVDTPTEFKLGDTAADIQRKIEEREQREQEEAEKQQRGRRGRERKPGGRKLHSQRQLSSGRKKTKK